ncbi:MAG: hypothetical protein WDN45_07400 [Caulobacteraceae bacterium]
MTPPLIDRWSRGWRGPLLAALIALAAALPGLLALPVTDRAEAAPGPGQRPDAGVRRLHHHRRGRPTLRPASRWPALAAGGGRRGDLGRGSTADLDLSPAGPGRRHAPPPPPAPGAPPPLFDSAAGLLAGVVLGASLLLPPPAPSTPRPPCSAPE